MPEKCLQSNGRIMTTMKEKNAYEKIYDVIREIPEGQVVSYGQVAELAGNRRWVRVVGYARAGKEVPLYERRGHECQKNACRVTGEL